MTIKSPRLQALTVADCHCPRCRKYHIAAFASYLSVPKGEVTVEGDALATYQDECDELGSVQRLTCCICATKMGTKQADSYHVCMGSLDDSTIPDDCSRQWQTSRQGWQLDSKPQWPSARPLNKHNMAPLEVTGGCSCGSCTYKVKYQSPSELQHCYCKLCRQLSGAAFQTWIPVHKDDFTWTSAEPELVRTTEHGQRHICSSCAGVLTIVYDEEPDTVWPAAGSIDNASLPQDLNAYLGRVFHICCIWKQDWYNLPDDGLRQVDYYDIFIDWNARVLKNKSMYNFRVYSHCLGGSRDVKPPTPDIFDCTFNSLLASDLILKNDAENNNVDADSPNPKEQTSQIFHSAYVI